MNDETRLGVDDAETPVNPYSLLAAVNASSRSASAAWLIYFGLLAYLYIAVAGITHRDLLLNADVTLPILQVKIGLTHFFLLVPTVVLLAHAALLGKLTLLARKTREFNAALRLLESTDERSHPLRLELDSFFLAQTIAGAERSRVISAFLNSVGWLTLVIFPVALLLYAQVAFLPFHDATITLVHRLAVLADIALVLLMGVFVMRPDTTYFGALWRTALRNPGSFAFAVAWLVGAAFLASFVATVPGHGRDDRAGLFAAADGALFGMFARNLHVTDASLVVEGGQRSINLRGRDLRSAHLDRSDLRRADLTGANLDGASLRNADLRQAALGCEESTGTRPAENQAAVCTSARGATFSRTRLGGAVLVGADLRGASFESAQLEGADLSNAQMTRASFARAGLQRAILAGVALQGALFEQANLQGADLSGARLQMADLSGAALQGATLARANLAGAALRDADLGGASLREAKLFGADLRGARLNYADLSGAQVWRTLPPGAENAATADMTTLAVTPPSDEDMARMRSFVEGLEAGPVKVRLAGLMAPLSDAGPNGTWSGSPEALAWSSLVRASETAAIDGGRSRIAEQLARLACRAGFADGAVAAGIVRRAGASGFRGDVAVLYDRVKADCPAAATMPAAILRDLAVAAGAARGQ